MCGSSRLCPAMMTRPNTATTPSGSFTSAAKSDHAPADHPDHARPSRSCAKSRLKVQADAHERQLEQDQPRAARRRASARGLPCLPPVEERARPRQEHEGRRAEVRDPAREEDARRRAAGGHARRTRARGRSPSAPSPRRARCRSTGYGTPGRGRASWCFRGREDPSRGDRGVRPFPATFPAAGTSHSRATIRGGGLPMLDWLRYDVKHALRGLLRDRAFTTGRRAVDRAGRGRELGDLLAGRPGALSTAARCASRSGWCC